METIVLGSAAGGGFPQWNCRCANCALAWARDPRARWRTQSSLAIRSGDNVALINASPDIGQQLRAAPMLWPRSARHSPISTVVLTSAEIDHVSGLSYLRERHLFDLVALDPVQAAIADNPLFKPVGARRVSARSDTPIAFGDGLEITLFPVPGKAPLYLEDESPDPGSDAGEAAGVSLTGDGKTIVYIPGCAAITDAVHTRASKADVVLFDGTLFDDEEMRRAGLGEKTGRQMGHMPMSGPGGSLDWLASLPARRKIYTHINNSNPVLIEGSDERRLVESARVEIAYDGMEIVP